MNGSMFERSGGFSSVRKVISSFYDKVLDSPRLSRHFTQVDMRVLIDHQTKFITFVMGGPASFTDTQLERVHTRLGITRPEFREMVDLLEETLLEQGLEPADVEHVRREVAKRELFIVSAD